MADLFDEEVDPAWREDLWKLIRETPWLDWLILTKRPQNIASMLPADWGNGYGTCPGACRHTTKAGARDCRVKLDGVPTIHCVHASCAKDVEEANRALRTQTLAIDPVPVTPELKRMAAEAKAKAAREALLKLRAEKALPGILKKYAWPYDKIVAASPLIIDPQDREVMVEAFFELFEEGGVLWIGDVTDTGKVEHAPHFKTKEQWLAAPLPEGPLTCPSSFFPGSVSRSKDNVATQRYLVVESDALSKNEVGAIFRWLNEEVRLPLHAVVDTAGKSLHGWFG